MKKFQRGGEPDYLADNWEAWGIEWEQRQNQNPGAVFHWHVIQGERVNHKLLVPLKAQTQDHCSFCDAFPVAPPSIETIEHFRPKANFPREAYRWNNLYFCCTHCQQKDGHFNDEVLRPDADDYAFDRYFIWNFITGEIEVNPLASPEDQHRADVTIRFFRLNVEHPLCRRLAMKYRPPNLAVVPDEMSYRHYV